MITNDWVAEPDKVKVVLFPRVIAVTFTTFRPGTVALIVVLVEIVPSVWFGVSPARVVEAAVASEAAVVSRVFEVVFVPPTAVNPEVIESELLVLNLK